VAVCIGLWCVLCVYVCVRGVCVCVKKGLSLRIAWSEKEQKKINGEGEQKLMIYLY